MTRGICSQSPLPAKDTLVRRAMLTCRLAGFLVWVPAASLLAQSANDAAKTLIGISFGLLPGGTLWDVPNQVIPSISPPLGPTNLAYGSDIWHLRRDLVTNRPMLRVHGTHFVNPHIGYTAEFVYYAFETRDSCGVVQHGSSSLHPGDPALPGICDSVATTPQGSRGSFVFQGGAIIRPFAGSVIQPYVEGLVGFATTAASTVTLASTFEGSAYPLYRDPDWRNVQPTGAIAVGLATRVVQGLQVRIEARNTWIVQGVVTGPAQLPATNTPVIQNTAKEFFTVLFGFDVVLANQRGRRY